jgi:1-phosphofructokinase family hexose kinase
MILTFTPNPSLDLLFTADALRWDDANRVDPPRMRPGGQGVNVVRAARALGADAMAVMPLGGWVGREMREVLAREQTPTRVVDIAGDTRVFVGTREAHTGRNLLLNPRGPRLSGEEVEALIAALREEIERARPAWVACCGSIPPGAPESLYQRVAEIAREPRCMFVADCDGAALRAAASSCDLLVPNLHEASRLLECEIGDVHGAAAAARSLRGDRMQVIIKLGEAGAVIATPMGVWHAETPRVHGGSAVGAGDALLAAFIIARERGAAAEEALCRGVAAGTATLLSEGSDLVEADAVDELSRRVRLRRVTD